jgi:Arc-like DNA binding dprotein
MARKPAEKVGLRLRMPEGLRRLVERSAKAHNRSMNTEIVWRLGESFQREDMQRALTTVAETAAEKVAANWWREFAKHPEVRRSLGVVLEKDMSADAKKDIAAPSIRKGTYARVRAPEEGK